jgi:hypothetical protein
MTVPQSKSKLRQDVLQSTTDTAALARSEALNCLLIDGQSGSHHHCTYLATAYHEFPSQTFGQYIPQHTTHVHSNSCSYYLAAR